MPNEFGQVQQGIQQIVKSATSGAWRHLTVKVSRTSFVLDLHIFLTIFALAILFEHVGRRGDHVLVLYR